MKIFLLLALLPAITQAAAPAAGNKVLWTQWYAYSVNDNPHGFYSEEVESRGKDKQLAVSQKWWERSETGAGVDQTYIGSVSKDDTALTPVAFYVERKRGKAQEIFDGRAKDGKFKVKVRTNSGEDKVELPTKGLILSAFFPLYMAKKGKAGKREVFPYRALVEDSRDPSFAPTTGMAKVTGEKETISGQACYKIELTVREVESIWWLTSEGKLCRALTPALGTRIEAVTEAQARATLGNP